MAKRAGTSRAGGGQALDEVLLRRFGFVRVVGGAAYSVGVLVLLGIFGLRAWPLALGVPVLAVVSIGYFVRSPRYPRTSVVTSLVADALVLGGGVAFLGGTGSGLVLLYSIVVVSAGILLGRGWAAAFTVFTLALGLAQLVLEEMGVPPALLHRADLDERLPILLVSLAGLVSVGFLTAIYASRLHELVRLAGVEAEAVRARGRRRGSFLRQATVDVRAPLARLEELAERLGESWEDLGEQQRRELAARLRMEATLLGAELSQLADVGELEEAGQRRPEPVSLRRVVEDCVVALGERLHPYVVEVNVPPLKVAGDRRAARRVVLNLLENVVEHTPEGTTVRVTAVTTGGYGVLVVTDTGPGVPEELAEQVFEAREGEDESVGLPLVAELCAQMGARVRHERPAGGGARFLVSFRLAPSAAPSADDVASPTP